MTVFFCFQSLGSDSPSSAPPWKVPDYSSDTGIASSLEKRLPTSHSSPASGFGDFSISPRLPKAQNPTITLLQKARGKFVSHFLHYCLQYTDFRDVGLNGTPCIFLYYWKGVK